MTTTVIIYSDGTTYTRTETVNADGSTTTHSIFRDGTEETITTAVGDGGKAGFIDPNTGAPGEELGIGTTGRQSWTDKLDG